MIPEPSSKMGAIEIPRKRRVKQIGDFRSEIESLIPGFIDAIKRGDAAGVAAYYTDGARVLFPRSEMITGRQAIQEAFQRMMDRGVIENNIDIVELVPMGEKAAYEIGKYTWKITLESGVTVTDKGKYVVIWKHDGESWKLDVDITNTSLPTT